MSGVSHRRLHTPTAMRRRRTVAWHRLPACLSVHVTLSLRHGWMKDLRDSTLQFADFHLVPRRRIWHKHPAQFPPRVRWTRTVCLTRRKSVSQTGLHLRRASASCSSARALLNLKRQPQRLSRLLGWKHHQLLPKPRRLHKLKRKRSANLHRRLWIPPLNRHRYRRTRTPLPRRNRRQPRERISFPLLPAPAQFQAPLRSLFRRKPCRLLTSNFKTHCEFGGCIQRNCYTTR
jgi:hypothetical protein